MCTSAECRRGKAPGEKLWGRRRGSWHHRRLINRWRFPVVQANDLSRSIVAFEQSSTLVVVIEMGARSWLVAASVPGVERQPLILMRQLCCD